MTTLPMPTPKPNEVLVKVISCGVCHGDAFMVNKWLPHMTLPRVPGHEVIGYAVAVGSGVTRFKVGDKVGRGWHGGHCFQCDPCMDGEHVACVTHATSGATSDGGFAEYMVAPFESLAHIPDAISTNTGGPLMCGGLTVFNALRNSPFKPGNVVAIQGIGGLGHLAIQYARGMGAVTVAISTSDAKESLAKQLGAHHYIDTSKQDAAAELKKLGGANIIIATGYDAKSQSALIRMLILTTPLPFTSSIIVLIYMCMCYSINSWLSIKWSNDPSWCRSCQPNHHSWFSYLR
jgi:propanol-preferring alcohol dehydrogenase